MIKVNKIINLEQLDKELNNLGLIAAVDNDLNVIEIGLAENNTATYDELKIAIDKHVAIDDKAERAKAKVELFAKLGITEDEAKLLLG